MENIVFAGSFDPITNGHLWVIKEALNFSKKVTIFIAENPSKKSFFNKNQKIELIKNTCEENGILDRVSVFTIHNQFVAQAALEHGADYMIRGIRSGVDFDYESVLQHANTDLVKGAKTLFVMPPRDLESVSSSFVKSLIGPVGWHNYVKKLVSKSVYNEIIKEYINSQSLKYNISGPTNMALINECFQMYDQPNRHYHTIDHIVQCLSELDKFNQENPNILCLTENQNLFLAILFHDCIYGQKSDKSDEELSANFMQKSAQFYIGSNCNLAYNYILLTQHINQKRKENLTEAEKIMISIDLSILGQPSDVYAEYSKNIRKEYSYVDDNLYNTGRIQALNAILANDQIFPSDHFSKYEKRARINIQQELTKLMETR